jgi:hypothetical protein
LPIADLPNAMSQIDNWKLAIGNDFSPLPALAAARDGIHQSALTNNQ